jgi:hypothetical protein
MVARVYGRPAVALALSPYDRKPLRVAAPQLRDAYAHALGGEIDLLLGRAPSQAEAERCAPGVPITHGEENMRGDRGPAGAGAPRRCGHPKVIEDGEKEVAANPGHHEAAESGQTSLRVAGGFDTRDVVS